MRELEKKGKDFLQICIRNSGKIEKLAAVLLCLGLCVFHYHVREYRADTLVFQEYLKQYDLWEFLTWRAETWSGRLLLEGALYIILKLPYWVFAVLDSVIIISSVYALRTIFEWRRLETTVFLLSLLCFPTAGLIEVGIQPGAINYIWALAAAVAAMIPLEMVYREKRIRWQHYICFGIAALIGCNMEQTAAIVFGFYLLGIVYFAIRKKLKPILFSQAAASTLSLIFLLSSKGNAIRLEQEMAHYWPGFASLSNAEKLWNGWFTTVSHYFQTSELPFLMFITGLCIWLWIKYRRVNVFTICGTLPFLVRAAIWAGKIPDKLVATGIREWAAGVQYKNGLYEAPPIPVYPQVILYSVLFLMMCVAVCGCFCTVEETLLILVILAAGLASRLVMGFSPTLIASGSRTFFFMDAALCIVAVRLIGKIRESIAGRL